MKEVEGSAAAKAKPPAVLPLTPAPSLSHLAVQLLRHHQDRRHLLFSLCCAAKIVWVSM